MVGQGFIVYQKCKKRIYSINCIIFLSIHCPFPHPHRIFFSLVLLWLFFFFRFFFCSLYFIYFIYFRFALSKLFHSLWQFCTALKKNEKQRKEKGLYEWDLPQITKSNEKKKAFFFFCTLFASLTPPPPSPYTLSLLTVNLWLDQVVSISPFSSSPSPPHKQFLKHWFLTSLFTLAPLKNILHRPHISPSLQFDLASPRQHTHICTYMCRRGIK